MIAASNATIGTEYLSPRGLRVLVVSRDVTTDTVVLRGANGVETPMPGHYPLTPLDEAPPAPVVGPAGNLAGKPHSVVRDGLPKLTVPELEQLCVDDTRLFVAAAVDAELRARGETSPTWERDAVPAPVDSGVLLPSAGVSVVETQPPSVSPGVAPPVEAPALPPLSLPEPKRRSRRGTLASALGAAARPATVEEREEHARAVATPPPTPIAECPVCGVAVELMETDDRAAAPRLTEHAHPDRDGRCPASNHTEKWARDNMTGPDAPPPAVNWHGGSLPKSEPKPKAVSALEALLAAVRRCEADGLDVSVSFKVRK